MISIIMPTYNQGKFIKRAIDSVLDQTFTDWELIIINGACTDDTDEICQSYTDPRIIYRVVPYCNMGTKLNLGICMAKGSLVGWLASDDYYHNNFMRVMSEALSNNEKGESSLFAYCDFTYSDGRSPGNNAMEYFGYEALIKSNHLGIFWLFKKSLWQYVGFFDSISGEDYDFALRCVESGVVPFYVPQVLACLGEHKDRASHNLDMDKIRKVILDKAEQRREQYENRMRNPS